MLEQSSLIVWIRISFYLKSLDTFITIIKLEISTVKLLNISIRQFKANNRLN